MRIATWNVNSIRARIDHLERWLSTERPDVVCLQETKVSDAEFPADPLSRLGYEIARAGQKTYNGVAILARHSITDVTTGLWDASPEEDKRLIAGTVCGVRVYSAYIPNGKSLDSPSYPEKLAWLRRLRETFEKTHDKSQPLVVGGDFNVARDGRDVFDEEAMRGQIHFSEPEHAAIDHLLDYGLVDSFRLKEEQGGHFTWWDYRMAAFRRNRGLRIDYLFVNPAVRTKVREVLIDKTPRTWEKPSDHTPVIVDFEL